MKKFIRLGVINQYWCKNIVKADDILPFKSLFKKKCCACGSLTNSGWKFTKNKTYIFCDCLETSYMPKNISYKRLVADYINLVLRKDIFTAKKTYFRKTDILAVEGCAYDQSIIHFNNNSKFSNKHSIRVSENKNEVLKYLGETYNK